MTKAQNIKYILQSQKNLDVRVVREQFPNIPYTKEQLNEMKAGKVKNVLCDILMAEEILEVYLDNNILH